jgi:hypothetical protein
MFLTHWTVEHVLSKVLRLLVSMYLLKLRSCFTLLVRTLNTNGKPFKNALANLADLLHI